MPVEITMPQLSDTMDEGTILSWLKKEGDSVSRGDALAEVATDKADLEIESFHEGVLLKIYITEGTTVDVGSVIAMVGEAGEEVPDSPGGAPAAAATPEPAPVAPAPVSSPASSSAPAAAPQEAVASPALAPAPAQLSNGASVERIKISPLAKNFAENQGVDYSNIAGSGEGGRIVKRDIEQALGAGDAGAGPAVTASRQAAVSQYAVSQHSAPQQTSAASAPAAELKPFIPASPSVAAGTTELSKMRQTIASRMVQSTTSIPHFYVTSKINVDELIRLRKTLKPLPQYEGITYNHLIVKACALALRAVPRINASFKDNALVQPAGINVGIITAVPDGLLIPVVKNADQLPLVDLVQEARGLVQRARSGRPKADDLSGGTFCVSNMGLFSVESFTAIINPGQGAILAVSSINEEPVVIDGQVKPGSVLRVTLSVDHRIIDGVVAGEFVTELKRLLEEPVLLLA